MKKIRIVAVLLCAVMLFSFTGCKTISQSVKDTLAIVGTWTSAPIDMTEDLNTEVSANLPEEYKDYFVVDNFSFAIDLTFTEDGKYAMSANEASVKKTVDNMEACFTEGVTKMYNDMAAEYNISIEDLLSANNYEDLDALVADTMSDFDFSQLVSDISEPMNISGTYTLLNGVMYLASEEDPKVYNDIFTYVLDGDTLSLNVSEEYAAEYSFELPLNFTR